MSFRVFILACLLTSLASAAVTAIEITEKSSVPGGYEKLVGTARFAVDPKLAANKIISDIEYGPLNARGQVEIGRASCRERV